MRKAIIALAVTTTLFLNPLILTGWGLSNESRPIPFTTYNHDVGNFSLNVDDAGGGGNGWDELIYPKGTIDHLNQAWLAVGNSTEVLCGGGAGEFTAGDFTLYKPGGEFDLNSTANFTGKLSGRDLKVHQRAYMNANSSGVIGHDGNWLVVEYTVTNTNKTDTAYGLHLMQYTDWKVNQSTDNSGFFRFDDKNMSVVYDITSNFSYYMASAQLGGVVKGHNAGVYDAMLHVGIDGNIWSEMSAPGNDSSAKSTQNWYTDLVAYFGDLGPGERSTVAFVFIAGNSTDELNASYEDAVSAYFVPRITILDVGGDTWKSGTVPISTMAEDVSPGKVVEVEFEYSANSTDGYDGDWSPVYGSPRTGMPYQVNWNTSNATTGTDPSVWVRVRAKDDYGRYSPYAVMQVMVDNQAPTTSHNYDGLWHNNDITVTLSANDNSGSGVTSNNIKYRINDGATGNVGANGQPVVTTESAANKLEYWSVDSAGNTEAAKQLLSIKIEKGRPIVTEIIQEPPDLTYQHNGDITIYTRIFDNDSGIETGAYPVIHFEHRDEGIQIKEYDKQMVLSTSKPGYWESTTTEDFGWVWDRAGISFNYNLRIQDNAGNLNITSVFTEDVEPAPPNCTFSSPDKSTWYRGTIPLKAVLSATTFMSNITIEYSLDNLTWIELVSETLSGMNELLYNWDTVGAGIIEDGSVWLRTKGFATGFGYSDYDIMQIKIDNKKPGIASVVYDPGELFEVHKGAFVVAIEITDSGAGIDYSKAPSPETNYYPVLRYKLGFGAYTAELVMTRSGTGYGSWKYSIPEPMDGWAYYEGLNVSIILKVQDRLGNVNLSGENLVPVQLSPLVPIIIEHTPLESAREGDIIDIRVNVTGGSDPKSMGAVCFYRYASGDLYDSKHMTLMDYNSTTATFGTAIPVPEPYPGTGEEAELLYYIQVSDINIFATSPAEDPQTNPYRVKITNLISNIFIEHTPPGSVLINQAIKVRIKITGITGDLSIRLFYKNVSAEDYVTKQMTRELFGEVGSYATNIPGQVSAGMVYYYFEITAGELIILEPEYFLELPYSIRIHKSDNPTILHTPLKSVYIGMSIIITANAYDNTGVVKATLNYRLSSMDMFLPVDMVLTSGDGKDGVYAAEIPKQQRQTTIYYYIEAWDGWNTGTYPPVNASETPLVLEVIEYPNTGPQITGYSPTPPREISAGESLVFNVTAMDPDGNDSALRYRWFVDNMLMPGETANNFTFITGKDDSGTHSVRVEITDENGTKLNFSWSLTINKPEDVSSAEGQTFSSVSLILVAIAIILALLVIILNLRIRRSLAAPDSEDEQEEDLEEGEVGEDEEPEEDEDEDMGEDEGGEIQEDAEEEAVEEGAEEEVKKVRERKKVGSEKYKKTKNVKGRTSNVKRKM